MARHSKTWKVETEGRDKGKHFLLTEMTATRAEKWAWRALLALINNNVQVPDGFENLGMAGLAQIGLQGLTGLPWHMAEPLLNEMMDCVQLVPDFPKFNQPRPLEEDAGDIEEVQTLVALRWEVIKLHTDFSEAAVSSLADRIKAIAAARQSSSGTASPK